MGAFFDLSYTVFKEIWVPPKIRVLPSGTLSQILDLDNFPHSKLILLSTKLVSGRACSTTTVDTPWLVTTHWSAITALLLFVMLVGRQEGHPACKKHSVGVLVWLSVWSKCRLAYLPADATATHILLLQIGFTFLVPTHLGSPGKGAVKRVCVCVLLLLYNLFLQLCSSWQDFNWHRVSCSPSAVTEFLVSVLWHCTHLSSLQWCLTDKL